MAIFKFIGSWLLAASALAIINDVTRGLAPGTRFAFLSMRGLWQMMHETSLQTAQAAITRVHPLLWDPVTVLLLKLPAWFLLAAAGFALCYLGRRRHRVEIFSN
jgi:hypothetical protein